MFKKKDFLLIFLLLVLVGGLLLLLPLLRKPSPSPDAAEQESAPSEAALYMRYSIDGEVVATLPLTEEKEMVVDQGNGAVNVLSLSPQGFVMKSSTCYNQLCIYQGEVTPDTMESRPLMNMIVCAPHRLVAELLYASEVERDSHE